MRWGLLLAAFVLFLIACSPAEEAIVAEEPVVEEEIVEPEPVSEPEPVFEPVVDIPEPVEEEGVYERPPETPPSIPKFLDHFRKEVRNYKFKYRNDEWTVEGKKAKVKLFRILRNKFHAPFIDTIYFDLDRKTAVGVCEGYDKNIKRQCIIQESLGKNYALPYVQFKIKLPEEWLTEFQNLYTVESETPLLVLDRETIHLKHSTRQRTTDLFIEPSSGLPVVVVDDSSEYHYNNLAKNQLTADEKMGP